MNNAISKLTEWNAKRAELAATYETAKDEHLECASAAEKLRARAEHLRGELNFYDAPRRNNEIRTFPSNWKEDRSRIERELNETLATWESAKSDEKRASKGFDAAEKALATHDKRKPAVTAKDISALAGEIAKLRRERERVAAALENMENAEPSPVVTAARSALEAAKKGFNRIAAAVSLGEANDGELTQAQAEVAKAEEAAKKAAQAARNDAAIAGLRDRLAEVESQFEQAEQTRADAVKSFAADLHHDAVGRINAVIGDSRLPDALADIQAAKQLLLRVRSEHELTNGNPVLEVGLQRHSGYASITGFAETRISPAPEALEKRTAELLGGFGLVGDAA